MNVVEWSYTCMEVGGLCEIPLLSLLQNKLTFFYRFRGRPETEAPICRYLSNTVGAIIVAPDYQKAPREPGQGRFVKGYP